MKESKTKSEGSFISKAHGILILALLTLLACSGHVIRVKSARSVSIKEAAKVLSNLRDAQSKIADIRLHADVKLDSKRRRIFLEEIVLAKRPGKIHLTSIKFGVPRAYVSITADEALVYDVIAGEFFKGKNTRQAIKKLTGVGFSASDLVELIFGSLYVPPDSSILNAELLNDRFYKLELGEPDEGGDRREILIDGLRGVLVYGRIKAKSLLETLDVHFSKHSKINDIYYPFKIAIKRQDPYLEISLKVKEVLLNDGVLDEALGIRLPPGVIPSSLESLNEMF